MGLFRNDTVVYKPVKEMDLSSGSSEVYLRANVKAPRMAGFLVKVFVWFMESRIFGPLLFYILKGNNLIHKHSIITIGLDPDPSSAFVKLRSKNFDRGRTFIVASSGRSDRSLTHDRKISTAVKIFDYWDRMTVRSS
ncbi:hypothetical protein TorRG33x02_153350 [Trema orientale]|uniref:Uncharacterized protein n=1 Tax=Trema orientale TaxID=63057 RepID=A0A2P5ETF7_TREOI|nr:hypothetical protein TorRG33x02_153350 [Trema orientale]